MNTPKWPERDVSAMHGDFNDAADDPLNPATLRQAADTIAGQAEVLAGEMESGAIADCGGPEALRLLAAVVRLGGWSALPVSGHG
jgi:hypothetical protein